MERNQIKDELIVVLAKFTPKLPPGGNLTEQTSLRQDLRIDSADMIDIILAVEERFSITINDEQLERIKNVGDLVSLVETLAVAA